MKIERNKDGSVTIRDERGTTVVSAISAVADDKRAGRYKSWVDYCAEIITACHHSIKETKEYFLQLCDAVPIAQDDIRMKNFMHNVVMNYFTDKLVNKPRNFSFDMTDEEIEAWQKEQDALYEEIQHSSPERFGLKMRGYYLPRTGRNEAYYENARLKNEEMLLKMGLRMQERIEEQKLMEEQQKDMCNGVSESVFGPDSKCLPRFGPGQETQIAQQDICFFFEETTGYCQSTGGGDDLMRELTVFMGVTQEDIDRRSPRFLAYISALRDMGKLPDLQDLK